MFKSNAVKLIYTLKMKKYNILTANMQILAIRAAGLMTPLISTEKIG